MLGPILAVFTYDYVACSTHSSAQRKECYMPHLRVLVYYKMHLSKSLLAFLSFRAVAFPWCLEDVLASQGVLLLDPPAGPPHHSGSAQSHTFSVGRTLSLGMGLAAPYITPHRIRFKLWLVNLQ